jgi:parallel beta-helix repeat protein
MLLVSVFGITGIAHCTIIYVDDDNTSGPWDGTQAHPFQNIQDGIDNANPRDTVFVLNGTYYENVLVDKSIFLTGQDRENTVVDAGGAGTVIYISVDSVNVSGFTIRNSGTGWPNSGIYAYHSDYSTISDNIVTSNGHHGIIMNYSHNDTISGNAVTHNNHLGIYLQHSSTTIVSGNNIADNSWGIDLDEAHNNNIISNAITDNKDYGIYIHASSEDTLFDNNIVNSNQGIFLSGAFNNDITENYIIGNNNGLYLRYSSNNSITGCDIRYNRNYGLYIEYYNDPSNDNIIYHNNFVNNTSQAHDGWSNVWDNGYPSGGNYWSDYAVGDKDGDDIGDTTYDISGGDNQDRYPLMYPWGAVTVFVDDDADPGWYDSIHVARIQEAIDSAAHEGFVYVNNGTYYENLTVAKKITLIGQYSDSVIVEGVTSGHLFSISADSVLIKGFTAQNNSSDAAVALLSDHNTILTNQMKSSTYGIYLVSPADSNTLSHNFAEANDYGIYLNSSSVNSIMLNHLSGNSYGIYSQNSSNNSIMLNHLSSNSCGIYSQNSLDNNIYHNKFTGNTQSAYDDNQENKWNLGYGYYSCGNYWDDYLGSDTLSGFLQDRTGSDGIGDTPYAIDGGSNQDNYPLMEPWADGLPLLMLYCGDANSDGLVTISDVVYLINYLFKSGTPPVPMVCVGDANGDGQPSISDVVYLIGYILRSATPPVDDCCW